MTTARCEFVLCQRDAELELVSSQRGEKPFLVCGLHVTPVLTWGVPHVDPDPIIRYLSGRPESAA